MGSAARLKLLNQSEILRRGSVAQERRRNPSFQAFCGRKNSSGNGQPLKVFSVPPRVCLDELRIAAGERTCQIASLLLESPEEVQPPLSISHIQYLGLNIWEQKRKDGKAVCVA